jgi:peptidoglycan/LPS O-acetylase OafA/YrhL
MGERNEFVALTSWRGICALAVAMFHFPVVGWPRDLAVFSNAYLFVDFFFVLSGFVITHSTARGLQRPSDAGRFIVKRFGRLWPLHAFILAILVLAAAVKGELGADERHSWGAIVTNLLMIHGLGIHADLTWNGPSWSISVEWLLYLLFALLAFVPARRWAYAALAAAGAVTLIFVAPNGMGSTFDYGAFRGFAGFFTGALVAGLPRKQLGTSAEVTVSAGALAFVSAGAAMFLAPFVFALVVYVFAGSRGRLSQLLHAKPLHLLGEWSYSVYMVHGLVAAVIWAAVPLMKWRVYGHLIVADGWADAVALGYVATTVGVSALLYYRLEKPTREYFRRLSKARSLATAIAHR